MPRSLVLPRRSVVYDRDCPLLPPIATAELAKTSIKSTRRKQVAKQVTRPSRPNAELKRIKDYLSAPAPEVTQVTIRDSDDPLKTTRLYYAKTGKVPCREDLVESDDEC